MSNITEMEIDDRVIIRKDGAIAEVVLNRPDKMNALDIRMFNAIIQSAEEVEKNASIRVVIIRGEGKAFCAGLDLSNFSMDEDSEMNSTPLQERTFGVANKWQKVSWAWRECSVPVIAAVHGVSFGGGLQIMLGSDIKYIHPDTRCAIMEMKWGLIPDMSGSQLMRHNIREDIVRELTYTNREFSGTQAAAYGFATHVTENPLEDARALAEVIASKSPSAIVNAKRLFNKAPYLSPEDGLMEESILQDKIIRKHNQIQAIFSSMQKVKGEFKDYR